MNEAIPKIAADVLDAIESRSPRALEKARLLAEMLVDGPPTNPAIPIAEYRRRTITSQTTVNQAEVFLGQLAACKGYEEQAELVKSLIRQSFDRGEAAARVELERLRADMESERARRIELEANALRQSKADLELTRLRVASMKFARGQLGLKEFMDLLTEKEPPRGS